MIAQLSRAERTLVLSIGGVLAIVGLVFAIVGREGVLAIPGFLTVFAGLAAVMWA